MTEKRIDMTAFGLFFVALVSLPIALISILGYFEVDYGMAGEELGALLMVCAVFIMFAALGSYKCNSNFGTTVFGLVGAGVFFAGYAGGSLYTNLTLAVIYLAAFVWSYMAKSTPVLTTILLTTSLIFLFGGIAVPEAGIWVLLKGLAALANFLLALYLAFMLVKAECVGCGCGEAEG